MAEACLLSIASDSPGNILGEVVINEVRVKFSGLPVIFMAHQEIVIRDDGGKVKVFLRDRVPG